MLSVAVQMDPIEAIHIQGDTTFAFMLAAQRRGYKVSYFEPNDIFFDRGVLSAVCRVVEVNDVAGSHFRILEQGVIDVSDFDVILVRQDPPFDMGYVSNTYLLELVVDDVLIVNSPSGIRNIPEKFSALKFYDLMAPTFVGRNLHEIIRFAADFEEVVLKPAFLGGGSDVFRSSIKDDNLKQYAKLLLNKVGKEPILVQKFLKSVVSGDKRVMMLGGQAAGVLRRIPPKGSFRANIHVGGTPELATLEPHEVEICERVGSVLAAEGIAFAGIDIIDGYLNEINVTSPTLVRELISVGGPNLAELFWDYIEQELARRS